MTRKKDDKLLPAVLTHTLLAGARRSTLQQLCRERNIPDTGTIQNLIARLLSIKEQPQDQVQAKVEEMSLPMQTEMNEEPQKRRASNPTSPAEKRKKMNEEDIVKNDMETLTELVTDKMITNHDVTIENSDHTSMDHVSGEETTVKNVSIETSENPLMDNVTDESMKAQDSSIETTEEPIMDNVTDESMATRIKHTEEPLMDYVTDESMKAQDSSIETSEEPLMDYVTDESMKAQDSSIETTEEAPVEHVNGDRTMTHDAPIENSAETSMGHVSEENIIFPHEDVNSSFEQNALFAQPPYSLVNPQSPKVVISLGQFGDALLEETIGNPIIMENVNDAAVPADSLCFDLSTELSAVECPFDASTDLFVPAEEFQKIYPLQGDADIDKCEE